MLVLVGICATLIAVSRHHPLWLLLAFPLVLGPFVAFHKTPTRWALLMGGLSSSFWSFVAMVPYFVLGPICIWAISHWDEGWVVSLVQWGTLAYFLAVSIVGGYLGGVASAPD
ncbi:MAG: hypothetical protein ACF8AM_03225 [Rhodopirellula sp. JB055]|uniref:hypothetical protein n=1 Tax=Rhodopirellula sp. JB055 TaxID=3342846 RepID=UPI00370CE286